MRRLRTIVAILVALTVAVAPLASATAAVHVAASTGHDPRSAASMTQGHAGLTAAANDTADRDMADCTSMMKTAAGTADCPCCDTENSCPPDLCLFKCFKVLSGILAPAVLRDRAAAVLFPGGPRRPPDWIDSPQPPPPRT